VVTGGFAGCCERRSSNEVEGGAAGGDPTSSGQTSANEDSGQKRSPWCATGPRLRRAPEDVPEARPQRGPPRASAPLPRLQEYGRTMLTAVKSE